MCLQSGTYIKIFPLSENRNWKENFHSILHFMPWQFGSIRGIICDNFQASKCVLYLCRWQITNWIQKSCKAIGSNLQIPFSWGKIKMFKYLMSSLMSTYENQDLLDMLYKTTHINCKEKYRKQILQTKRESFS